jgi:succinate dehydrogenase/fumarate reductase flavoprotein subunit
MVHFRDTIRGGKFLNDWRMADLHAPVSTTCTRRRPHGS